MQSYTDNANGDVSLTVEKAWYFWFVGIQLLRLHVKMWTYANWGVGGTNYNNYEIFR